MCGEGCERYLGISILELVLRRLREEGFTASAAYPGQKFPVVSGTVAAVHIQTVDRANMTVTVEVSIICPASMGGAQCEMEALRATEALRWMGAVCVQNGCSYDGVSQVYVVPVLATFVGVTEEDSCEIGPGFYVYVNGTLQGYAYCFCEEEVEELQAEYGMGESAPLGISSGKKVWKIRVEDLIPAGSSESVDPKTGAFDIRVVSANKTEHYYHCKWTSVKREFTREGLRRIRTGISMLRLEE